MLLTAYCMPSRNNKKQKTNIPLMSGLVADWIKLVPPPPPCKHTAMLTPQANQTPDIQSPITSDSDPFTSRESSIAPPPPTQPRHNLLLTHRSLKLSSNNNVLNSDESDDIDNASDHSITPFEIHYEGF